MPPPISSSRRLASESARSSRGVPTTTMTVWPASGAGSARRRTGSWLTGTAAPSTKVGARVAAAIVAGPMNGFDGGPDLGASVVPALDRTWPKLSGCSTNGPDSSRPGSPARSSPREIAAARVRRSWLIVRSSLVSKRR
jgi:hypothetical protein